MPTRHQLSALLTVGALVASTVVLGTETAAAAAGPPAPPAHTPAAPHRPASAKDAEHKVAAKVRKAFESKTKADFWVAFNDQADLSDADDVHDWAAKGRYVVEQLQATAAASQGAVVDALDASGVKHQDFWVANAVLVKGGSEELAEALAARPEVAAIAAPTSVPEQEPIAVEPAPAEGDADAEWGVADIKAPEVWAKGITGQGITVANLDTGVDGMHPALADKYRGARPDGTTTADYAWWEPFDDCGGAPCDSGIFHGTHTMGTMVGDGGPGNHIGVAPGAKWIAANSVSYGTDAIMLAGAQWLLAPTRADGTAADPAQRPHIINNSWGGGTLADSAVMPQILDAWEAAGIFDVWSNGNSGPLCETTGNPGGLSGAYSVGAYGADGSIASFSSRGDGTDGTVKPDIAAPGVDVRSAVADGQYGLMSGTSMAAPHVAGAVALLWSAAPSLVGDIDATRRLLDETAHDVDDTSCGGTPDDNDIWGEGTLDVAALIAAAPTEAGVVQGTITGPDGTPLADASITVDSGARARTVSTDAAGQYTTRVAPGEHRVTVRSYGYTPQTRTVDVADKGTTTLDVALETAPRFTVSGTVRDTAGTVVAGATVALSAPGAPTVTATAGADGTYALTDVPQDAYTVQTDAGVCTTPTTGHLDVDADTQFDPAMDRLADALGYTCSVGSAGSRPGGAALSFSDGELATADLPFAFPFYGGRYDSITVADNGWLSFLPQSYATFSPYPIPNQLSNPTAAVFAYLGSYTIDDQSGVYTGRTQVDGDDAFVVEWRNVKLSWSESRATFSVTLYADGRIELGYGPNTDPTWFNGAYTTVGIENATGTDGWQVAYNRPGSIHAGMSVLFARPAWGRVSGTLTDATDHQPLADTEVRLVPVGGGLATTAWTKADGTYAMVAKPGKYDVSIAPRGYERVTERVDLREDLTEADVSPALRTGVARVLGGTWEQHLVQGQTARTELELSNDGTASLTATVATGVPADSLDGPPHVNVTDPVAVSAPEVSPPGAERAPSSRGTEIGQFYAARASYGQMTPLGVGLDNDGSVWVSDVYAGSPANLEYDRDGTLVGEHDVRVNPGERPWALTWDSTLGQMCQTVRMADNTSTIRCYDQDLHVAHELAGDGWSAYAAYGIAHDPRTDVFYLALPDVGSIVTIAGTTHEDAGAMIGRCDPQYDDPVGLAFNGTSRTLWMSSGAAEHAFVQIDPATCTTLHTVAAPRGVINGALWDLETDETGALWAVDAATDRVRLVDVGDPLLTPVNWVHVEKQPGTLAPGEHARVALTVDTAGLEPGTYTAHVAIASSAGRAPLVWQTLTVAVVDPLVLAVDVGGPGIQDAAGTAWSADQPLAADVEWGVTDGKVETTKKAIAGTDDDALYRTARTGPVAYTFRDLPAGTYEIDLRFVDLRPHAAPGSQVADVVVDGEPVITGLDVAGEVGGLTALTRTVDVTHDGGDLTVGVQPVAGKGPGLAGLRVVRRSVG